MSSALSRQYLVGLCSLGQLSPPQTQALFLPSLLRTGVIGTSLESGFLQTAKMKLAR